MNTGEQRALDVTFADAIVHQLRAEPGSFFSPRSIFAFNATLLSDSHAFRQGVQLIAQKLVLNLDFAANQPTTFFFLIQPMVDLDSFVAHGNTVACDKSSFLDARNRNNGVYFRHLHGQGLTQWMSRLNQFAAPPDGGRYPDFQTAQTFPQLLLLGNVVYKGAVLMNACSNGFLITSWDNLNNNSFWETQVLQLNGTRPQSLDTNVNHPFKAWLLQSNQRVILDFRCR